MYVECSHFHESNESFIWPGASMLTSIRSNEWSEIHTTCEHHEEHHEEYAGNFPSKWLYDLGSNTNSSNISSSVRLMRKNVFQAQAMFCWMTWRFRCWHPIRSLYRNIEINFEKWNGRLLLVWCFGVQRLIYRINKEIEKRNYRLLSKGYLISNGI